MVQYRRRGFRLPNNTLLLLLIFFTVGLFLHYKGKTGPVRDFWEQLKSAFAGEDPRPANPYKVPEPNGKTGDTDTLAVDYGNGGTEGKRKSQKPLPRFGESGASRAAVSDAELDKTISAPWFVLPAGGPRGDLVRRVGYSLTYVDRYKLPSWVAYTLTSDQLSGNEERPDEFIPDPAVRNGTAVSSDYVRSGYDRGHMAPAADFKHSYQVMKETFYMSNICPQHPQFNRGVWLDLEKLVRAWAYKYRRIQVVTGPVLEAGLPTIGQTHRVAVPRRYFKVVLYAKPPYVKGIAFLMDNRPSDAPLQSFVVSIDEVERQTGIDFFSTLPDSVEEAVESRSRPGEWYRL